MKAGHRPGAARAWLRGLRAGRERLGTTARDGLAKLAPGRLRPATPVRLPAVCEAFVREVGGR